MEIIKKCQECEAFIYQRSIFCSDACRKRYKYKTDPLYRQMRLKKSSQSVYQKRNLEKSKWKRLNQLTLAEAQKINEMLDAINNSPKTSPDEPESIQIRGVWKYLP